MRSLILGTTVELEVLLKGRVLARSSFRGDVVRIGRSPDCDVFIDNAGVSRSHATLRREDGVWTLEDEKSSSGTFVNGQRVRQFHLTDGDRIGIAKFTIQFHARDRERVEPVRLPGGRTVALPEDGERPADREERSALVGRLVLGSGREVPIERDVFTIGGATQSDLVLPGWMVPADVAVVTRGLAGFSIVSVAGGEWVSRDGRPVEWDEWLAHGNVLHFGRTRATFLEGAATGERVPEESESCPR